MAKITIFLLGVSAIMFSLGSGSSCENFQFRDRTNSEIRTCKIRSADVESRHCFDQVMYCVKDKI